MPKPPKTWKAVELAVARLLGGRRCHFEAADAQAGPWAIEVKHGKQIPKTILKWWTQARTNAILGRKPLLVLHPPKAEYQDSLAVIRLGDLADFLRERDEETKAQNEAPPKAG